MKLTGETKLFIGIAIFTIVAIGGAMAFFGKQTSTANVAISKADLIPAGTYTRGNASASAYLVEFSDLQCPACKAYEPTVDAIVQQFGSKLLYAYRYFPLSQHPYSTQAATAAEAANRQGKFWELHDQLFTDQDTLSDDTVQKDAQKVGLNMDQFNKDLKDSKIQDKIQNDIAAGNKFGVNATPTFFLNGIQLSPNSFQDLQQSVADAVK